MFNFTAIQEWTSGVDGSDLWEGIDAHVEFMIIISLCGVQI